MEARLTTFNDGNLILLNQGVDTIWTQYSRLLINTNTRYWQILVKPHIENQFLT